MLINIDANIHIFKDGDLSFNLISSLRSLSLFMLAQAVNAWMYDGRSIVMSTQPVLECKGDGTPRARQVTQVEKEYEIRSGYKLMDNDSDDELTDNESEGPDLIWTFDSDDCITICFWVSIVMIWFFSAWHWDNTRCCNLIFGLRMAAALLPWSVCALLCVNRKVFNLDSRTHGNL